MNKKIGIFLCLFIIFAGITTTTYSRRYYRRGCYRHGRPYRYRRGYRGGDWGGAAFAIPAIIGGVAATAAAASEAKERERARAYEYYDYDYNDDELEEEWEK